MRSLPPISNLLSSRPSGPGRQGATFVRRAAIAAMVVVLVASGCASPPPSPPAPTAAIPSLRDLPVAGLVVATGGPLLITDDTGELMALEPAAADPPVALTAAAGGIVILDRQGAAQFLDGSTIPGAWTPVQLPPARAGQLRFLTLAPSGNTLALLDGRPQGSSFTVTLVELRTGTTRTIPAARGLNGPPSWLGPGVIALDVVRADGCSGIATLSITDGVTHDEGGPGTVLAASADGSQVAVDDPATGDVLVGDVTAWRAGGAGLDRILGPPAAGVERLALSADGTLLAVARRTDAAGSIEILLRGAGGWRSVRTLATAGDLPIAIAWRR